MGLIGKLLDSLFAKNDEIKKENSYTSTTATYQMAKMNKNNIDAIKEKYVVLDVETTGINVQSDRIIELGAAIYEKGQCVNNFDLLVNPGCNVPKSATKVNNITTDMIKTAAGCDVTYKKFIDFLGNDTVNGDVVIIGYNVTFDMNFVCAELNRLGIHANFVCFDVMKMAKKYLTLDSYKQINVASNLQIEVDTAHRALADAKTCANIFEKLSVLSDREINVSRKKKSLTTKIDMTDDDLEFCAVIDKILKDNNISSPYIRYKKLADGSITANVLYKFAMIKRNTKGTYILLNKDNVLPGNFTIAPATKSEDSDSKIRAYFSSPKDLFDISDIIIERFHEHDKYREDYMNSSKRAFNESEDLIDAMYFLSQDIAEDALLRIETKAYAPVCLEKPKPVKKEKPDKPEAKNKNTKPVANNKRPIIQLDDDGNIITEYESVAAAVKATGINSKSIRDAANGVQKHAGGYVWQYK